MNWKVRGDPINIQNILSWACIWNTVDYEEIPELVLARNQNNADIRVKFSRM